MIDETPSAKRRSGTATRSRRASRPPRPRRGKGRVERFFGRHPRLQATLGCTALTFLTGATAVVVWRARATDGTGWAGWVAAGLALPFALLAVTVFCLRRRRARVLRRVGTITGATLLAGYLAGILSLRFGAGQPGAGPVLAGLLAQTLPAGAFCTLACAWMAVRPPYRTLPRWVRWLLRKI